MVSNTDDCKHDDSDYCTFYITSELVQPMDYHSAGYLYCCIGREQYNVVPVDFALFQCRESTKKTGG